MSLLVAASDPTIPALLRLGALTPVAYLAGSVPFGLLVGLAKGKDPRQHGSHNIGATNVGRLFGAKWFAIVFVLDALKGLLPMLAATWVMRHADPGDASGSRLGWPAYAMWILVGFAAILGHMYSVFLRLAGGKGVSTSAGVILGLFPYFTYPALAAMAVFAACFAIRRIISLSSLVAAATFPVAYVVFALLKDWHTLLRQWPLLAFALLISGMIVYKHRENIARLRAGTEERVGDHARGE